MKTITTLCLRLFFIFENFEKKIEKRKSEKKKKFKINKLFVYITPKCIGIGHFTMRTHYHFKEPDQALGASKCFHLFGNDSGTSSVLHGVFSVWLFMGSMDASFLVLQILSGLLRREGKKKSIYYIPTIMNRTCSSCRKRERKKVHWLSTLLFV